MTVGNAIQALRVGWILRNPETWKHRTVAVNALVALIGVVLAVASEFGYALQLDEDIVSAVALSIWGVFNAWSTVATTAKIGVRSQLPGAGLDGQSGNAGSDS